jgi:hypothetical protein
MWILVSGASKTVMELMPEHENLGVLMVPLAWNLPPPLKTIWAADNGAYSGLDEPAYLAMLDRIRDRPDCRWVTAPDVVGEAEETLRLWRTWAPRIREYGQRPALVCQDGLTVDDVPWNEVGAIFIGGRKGSPYKTGYQAAAIVAEANRRNLWTHMGRVNSTKRILLAAAMGCRSVDGSGFSRYSDTHLPWALRVARQMPLLKATA